jgi:hypothetical protein
MPVGGCREWTASPITRSSDWQWMCTEGADNADGCHVCRVSDQTAQGRGRTFVVHHNADSGVDSRPQASAQLVCVGELPGNRWIPPCSAEVMRSGTGWREPMRCFGHVPSVKESPRPTTANCCAACAVDSSTTSEATAYMARLLVIIAPIRREISYMQQSGIVLERQENRMVCRSMAVPKQGGWSATYNEADVS